MQSTFLLFTILTLTVYGQLVIKTRAPAHAAVTVAILHKLPYPMAILSDIGVLSVVVAGICWMSAIERLELGVAYPFMALSSVLMPVASAIILGHVLASIQLIGLGFIIVGVALSAIAR